MSLARRNILVALALALPAAILILFTMSWLERELYDFQNYLARKLCGNSGVAALAVTVMVR